MFDWDRAFADTNINEKVFIFTKTILNIVSNFMAHEQTVDDKNRPWFTKKRKFYWNLNFYEKNYKTHLEFPN